MDIETQINEIMENFDFKKVAKVMKKLDWVWYHDNNFRGIPDLDTIEKHARQRLFEAIGNGYSSSGGFVAKYSDSNLSLTFEIDSWSCENEG